MPKTDSETSNHAFDPDAAVRRLSRSEAPFDEIEAKLLKLVHTARNQKREAELLDALEALDLRFFGSMNAIEAVLMLAASVGRTAKFKRKFDGFRAEGVTPPRWAPLNKRKAMMKRAETHEVDESVVKRLVSLKYVQGPTEFATLADAADYFAPRIELPPKLVDVLFDRQADPALDREQFAARLKRGFALEQVLGDLRARGGKERGKVPAIRDEGDLWAEGALTPWETPAGEKPRPVLFLTFHGGLFLQAKNWFKKTYPDGIRIGTGPSEKIVSAKVNANGALLEAYRSLTSGKPLLIAADSPLGTAKNLLTVLGREIPVADGFVFLAFESKAKVSWIVLAEEEGGRLAPRFVDGPSREPGEKIAAYRERLLAFVGERITDYITGDPAQVTLPQKWMELLAGDSETYKNRHYKPEPTAVA